MSIALNLGFIVGPALAGILSVKQYGDAAPVLGAIVISFIGIILLVFFTPESKQCSPKEPTVAENSQKLFGYKVKKCETTTQETAKPAFREISKLSNIPYMLGLNFLIDLSFNIFYTAFPLHAIKVLEWNLAQMSLYFTVLCIFLVFVQGPVLSWASKKYSDAALIIFGSLMLGTNFLLLISGDFFLIYLATVFFALGDGLMTPSFFLFCQKSQGKDIRAQYRDLPAVPGVWPAFSG